MTEPVVIVLGLYRGGTSCTAGVLHRLGVDMGRHLFRVLDYETYEAIPLKNTCIECYSEPWLETRLAYSERVLRLRKWFELRKQQRHDRVAIGAKHPLLTLMGPEVTDAVGGSPLTFVSVDRPLDQCQKSLRQANWWPTHGDALLERLWNARNEFLADRDHVTVDFMKLREDPATTVETLVKDLNLSPSAASVREAVSFVKTPAAG